MYQKDRLGRLLYDSGLSQDKFAAKCGLSLAAMKNYLTDRVPNTESLLKICESCSVSSDWLLGLSDVQTPSADKRAVCEFTGLSEKAVEKIVTRNEIDIDYGKVLSRIIESKGFTDMAKRYAIFINFLCRLKETESDNTLPGIQIIEGGIALRREEAINYFKQQIVLIMAAICDEEIRNVLEK